MKSLPKMQEQQVEHPFVFNHRYGQATFWATDALAAIEVAKHKGRGMPMTPAFTVPTHA
jgi:hypothetical protein